MADRIAVMSNGRIEQTGAPQDIYAAPATAFVAGFVGRANWLPLEHAGDGSLRPPASRCNCAPPGRAARPRAPVLPPRSRHPACPRRHAQPAPARITDQLYGQPQPRHAGAGWPRRHRWLPKSLRQRCRPAAASSGSRCSATACASMREAAMSTIPRELRAATPAAAAPATRRGRAPGEGAVLGSMKLAWLALLLLGLLLPLAAMLLQATGLVTTARGGEHGLALVAHVLGDANFLPMVGAARPWPPPWRPSWYRWPSPSPMRCSARACRCAALRALAAAAVRTLAAAGHRAGLPVRQPGPVQGLGGRQHLRLLGHRRRRGVLHLPLCPDAAAGHPGAGRRPSLRRRPRHGRRAVAHFPHGHAARRTLWPVRRLRPVFTLVATDFGVPTVVGGSYQCWRWKPTRPWSASSSSRAAR